MSGSALKNPLTTGREQEHRRAKSEIGSSRSSSRSEHAPAPTCRFARLVPSNTARPIAPRWSKERSGVDGSTLDPRENKQVQ
jgi:hypothetical protein